MHTYSAPVVIVLIIGVVALMWWSAGRNGRRIVERQFKATQDPGGPYTECDVRFVLDDLPTPCTVRTTREGWYMVTPAWMRKQPNWNNNLAILRQPVFIPWAALDYYPAKFPLRDWTRFDVKGTRAIFFVRNDVALSLLQAGSMPPPRERG
jgi:hypothetical protein